MIRIVLFIILKLPFLVAYALRLNGRAEDLLSGKEAIGEVLPGNMKVADENASCNIRIAVDEQVYEKFKAATQKKKIYFHNIGYIYDYQRLNNMSPSLDFDNSDPSLSK